jgi:hypothetical protein
MKNMKTPKPSVMLLIFALLAGSNSALASDFWLGAKAGTLGIGIEAAWRPIPWMDIRAGGSAYDYKEIGSQAGINYDAKLRLSTYYASANFLFPASPFRISLGAYSNNNEVQMVSAENSSYNLGGTSYYASDVGTLNSITSFDGTSPYIGAGFDFSLFGKVGMNLDFGVLWQGDPTVSLTADGLLASDPTFMDQLEQERLELEDDFDALKAYPVVSLGFSYRF